MPSDKRLIYLLEYGVKALVLGFGGGALAAVGLSQLFSIPDRDMSRFGLPIMGLLGIACAVSFALWRLNRLILASRNRLSDPNYREELRGMGLIENDHV